MKSINYVVAVAAILFAASMVVCCLPADDSDAAVNEANFEFTVDGVGYTILNPNDGSANGKVKVTGYAGASTEIEIPSVVTDNGFEYDVTEIGSYAFNAKTTLTEVSLPGTLKIIRNNAFNGCSGISSMVIPDSVESIEANAFYDCNGLTSLTVGSGVTSFGTYAFYRCDHVTELIFKSSATSCSNVFDKVGVAGSGVVATFSGSCVPYSVFYNDAKLVSVTLSDSVQTIGRYAFYGMTSLTEVDLGAGLTTIGENAFYRCTGIQSIDIPASVTSISNYAFQECSGLTAVNYNASNITSSSSSVFTNAGTGGAGITLTFGPDVRTVPSQLFKSGKFVSVIFEEGAEVIKSSAFTGNRSIRTVVLPDSLQTVENGAFQTCSGIETITTGSGPLTLGGGAFGQMSSLDVLNWNASTTTLESVQQFYSTGDESSGMTVNLGNSVVSIPTRMFYSAGFIREIVIGDSVQSIGSEAFTCTKPTFRVTIGSAVESVASNSFGMEIYEVFNKSSLNLSDRTQYGNLASARHLYSEGDSMIVDVSGFLFFKDGADSVLLSAPAASDVALPDLDALATYGITTYSVFRLAIPSNGTVSIYIPENVVDFTLNSNLRYSSDFTTIDVAAGNEFYASEDHILYTKDMKTLLVVPSGRAADVTVHDGTEIIAENGFYGYHGVNVVLPDTVSSIGISAFSNTSNMTSLNLGSGITDIGDHAFVGAGFTTIDLPEGLLTIGNAAFGGTHLTSIVIPSTVTSIGADEPLFYWNGSVPLTTVTIGSSENGSALQSLGNTFYSCNHLSSVTIYGDSLKTIGYRAFYGCGALTTFTIPSSVTSIGNSAFYLSGLTSVTTPADCTSIGTFAFYMCPIVTATIGGPISTLSDDVFSGCASLTTVNFDDSSKLTRINRAVFDGCTSLTSFTIPSNVNHIGSATFNNTGLTAITIPASVSSLESGVFTGNLNLTEVVFLGGNAPVSSDLFSGCVELTTVTLPEGIRTIGNGAFNGCAKLVNTAGSTGFVIPDTVASIGSNAFNGCAALVEVTLGSELNSIGSGAFLGCAALETVNNRSILAVVADSPAFGSIRAEAEIHGTPVEKVQDGMTFICNSVTGEATLRSYSGSATDLVIPEQIDEFTVTVIYDSVFRNNATLQTVTLPVSIRSLGPQCFYGCGSLTAVNFSDLVNLEYIGERCFQNCSKLVSADLSNTGLQIIYQYTFYTCSSIDAVSLPSTLQTIETYAFAENTAMQTLSLGGVVTIGDRAFNNCQSLTELVLPASVRSVGTYAFYNCKALASVDVKALGVSFGASCFYCSSSSTEISSFTFSDGGYATILGRNMFYSAAFTELVLPEGLLTIENTAINSCSSLVSLSLPSTLASLPETGDGFLYGASALTEITIAPGCAAYKISDGMLMDASETILFRFTGSGDVTVPSTVRVIMSRAFEYSQIGSLTLPEGLIDIRDYAFQYSGMVSVNIPSTVETIGTYAFYHCESLSEVTIADGVESLSSNMFSYCRALTAVSIPSSVVSLGSYVFAYSGLTEIEIPEGIVQLPENAFYSCRSLTEVTLPGGLTTIRGYAFYNCSSLLTISIPASVTTLGDYLFYGCTKLESASMVGSTITSIPELMFYECSSLVSFEIPSTVTRIEYSAFSGCTSLVDVSIPSGVTYIGSYAFRSTAIAEITIPAAVTDLSNWDTFSNCKDLREVIIETTSITSIVKNMFNGCISLQHIEIPEGVTTIGASAFTDCHALKAVTLPSTLTSVDSSAFAGCDSIRAVYNKSVLDVVVGANSNGYVAKYAADVSSNSNYTVSHDGDVMYIMMNTVVGEVPVYTLIGYHSDLDTIELPDVIGGVSGYTASGVAFTSMTSATAFSVSDSNTALKVVDGVLFSKDGTKLIAYPIAKPGTTMTLSTGASSSYARNFTVYVLPAEVQEISEFAFFKCSVDVYSISDADFDSDNVGRSAFAVKGWNNSSSRYIYILASGDFELASFQYGLNSGTSEGYFSPSIYTNNLYVVLDFTYGEEPVKFTKYQKIGSELSSSFRNEVENSILGYVGASSHALTSWSPALPSSFVLQDRMTYVATVKNTYTVIYQGNGGVGSLDSQKFTCDVAQNLSAAPYTKNGYTFAGWLVYGSDPEVFLADEEEVINLSTVAGSTVTLIAQWTPNKYTATVLPVDGAVTPVPSGWVLNDGVYTKDFDFGTASSAVIADFGSLVKEGYTFNGFDSDVSTMGTSGMQLTAKWTIKSYTITFETSGGSSIAPITQNFGTTVVKPSDPVRTGFDFAGWDADVPGVMPSYDLTITALWDVKQYTVKMNLRSATVETPADGWVFDSPYYIKDFNYGTAILDIIDDFGPVERTGFEFGGWDYSGTTLGASTLTIFAVWNILQYPVTADLAGGSFTSVPDGWVLTDDVFTKNFNYGTIQAVLRNDLGTPVREGYTFAGWSFSADKVGLSGLTVSARWTPCAYNITYNLNGGVNGANPATYTIETATIALAGATKDHYDFVGWYAEQEFTNQVTQIVLGSTGDVALFAKWAPTAYSITYNLNGGVNGANSATYTIESSDIEFAPATKTGYTFGGWFTDSDCTVAKAGIAAGSTGPVTVYAKWTPVTYSITYNLDGGVNGTNPETYNVETATIALASATRTGYHFLGWYAEQEFTNQVTQIVLGSTGDVALFAKWAPWTAKVAFYGNGADDGAVPSDELVYDVPFTLPANNFVKAGKVFMGWARSDAVDAPVVFSDRATVLNGFTDGESFNLYAVWGDRSLSAVITLDGNPYGGLTVTATDDDDVVFELVETGAGTGIYYTFDGIHNGWYAVSVDDVFLFNLEVNNNAASRTKGYFTVSFDSVGGSSVESQVILGGQTATVPAAPTKAGYTFNAWMSGIEAAEITDGTFVQKIEATTQFTATWAAVTYAISYNLNGGVNGANPATYTVESSEIVFDDATRNGYDFGGWYSDSACTVAKTSVAAGSTGDVAVYAKWTATEFAVTYNLNGGVNGANPATYTVESSEIVFVPATKAGYEFGGWFTDSECTVAKTGIAAGSTGDVAVYAKWTPVTYSITYNLNGGVNGINPATYTVETATIVFAAATKENYDFIGWYTEQEFTNKVTKIASGSTGDVTVYALWLPATYTISYNLNGGVNGANPATYTVESSEIVFAPATKTGYDFAGWYTDSECTVAKTGIAAGSTGAVTVYAMWVPVIYTVSYNLNGGENGVNPVSYTIESSEIVFEAATKTGYDFAGWYTDSECTVAKTSIAAGSTGDVTLFAKWTPVKYAYAVNYLDMDDNVIAEAVNGTADYASSVVAPLMSVTGYTCTESEAASITISSSVALNVYTYRFTVNQYDVVYQVDGEQVFSDRFAFGTEVTVRPVFDKTGYDVTAWSGVAITDGKFTLGATDVLLTATSTVQEYTVSFNANGGTGVMENVNFTYAVTGFVQPVCGFTAPADKEFIGWALEADGAAVAGNIILTSDVTLYAVWGLTEIDIAFDANTGVGTMAPIHFTRGDSVTITNSFTKEHYDFIGWNTVADGSGASYANGVDANLVSTSCTLYAQWQIQTFTLTYMVDEEVYASDVYDWNTVVTVLPVIEKTGYTVSAWTGAEIVDGKVTIGSDVTLTSTTTVNQYTYVISYVSTSTVVLNQQIGTADYGSSVVAPVVEIAGYTCDSTVRNILIKADAELNTMTYVYAPVTYTIAYELNGGAAVNDTEYTIESADIVFAAAVRDAYEFAGWFTDSEFTNARASIATGSTGDVTVYAKWTPVTYNVTYVNTDGAVNSNVTTYTVESAEIVFDDATRTGYDFAGWFADSACTVAKAGIAAGSTGDLTVYAKWTPVTYSITYMDVEGAVNSNPVSYTIEDGFTLAPASKDGSRFVGWFYTVEARQSVDNVAVGTTGDLVFYAVWAKNVSEPVNNTVEIAADEGKDYVAVVLDTGLDLNSVVVKFNNGGSVSFPTSVLSKAGTVTMKQVDKSILTPEAQEKVGSAPVFVLDSSIATNFGSDVVTVSLPYAGEVKDGQTVVAYWIKDNGELEAHDAVYNSATKTVDFTTNHFSNWTIKVFDAPAPAPSENNGGGSNTALILGVVAVVIVAALGALFFLDQKGIVNILPKKKE